MNLSLLSQPALIIHKNGLYTLVIILTVLQWFDVCFVNFLSARNYKNQKM